MELPTIFYSPAMNGAQTAEGLIVFLHGKLAGRGVERPAFHVAPLLCEVVALGNLPVMMPEFHGLFARIREEPLNLDLGPISSAVLQSLLSVFRNRSDVPVVAYSFGCVLLAKLLRTGLAEDIGPLVLIAPVISQTIRESWEGRLSEQPTLVTWGTHDNFVKAPESLKTWFPSARFSPVEGGNHLYYLMPSPMDRFDENPATVSPQMQRRLTAERLLRHLGIDEQGGEAGDVRMVEVTSKGKSDLTSDSRETYRMALAMYGRDACGK